MVDIQKPLDNRLAIVYNRGMAFSTPRPRKLKRYEMNPWDVQVEDETEEDVWCEKCDLMIRGAYTRWISGENVGEAECPICDAKIEVIPDDCWD